MLHLASLQSFWPLFSFSLQLSFGPIIWSSAWSELFLALIPNCSQFLLLFQCVFLCFVLCFGGLASVRSEVGLGDLEGLFPPRCFCDSMILSGFVVVVVI